MEETVKQRLMKFIAAKEISLRTFAKMTGLSSSYISNLKSSPSANKLNNILSAFPELNPDWLMTGEGTMLKTITQTSHGDNSPNIAGNGNTVNMPTLDKALDEIAEMRKLLEKSIQNNKEQADNFFAIIEKLSEK